MTITARNAGADTVAGVTRPPALSVNVAGTRTWIDPAAGFVLVRAGDAPPLAGVLVALGLVVWDAVVLLAAVVLGGAAAVDEAAVVAAALAAVLVLDECDSPHPASASTAANGTTWRLRTFPA